MRVRSEHWQILLGICENNPELITNKFNGVAGKVRGNALWQSVASKLNGLVFGEKSVEGWRKTLTDWKSKTKAKASAIKREMEKTGGGPNELPPLSSLEEKLLSIMGSKSVTGDEEIPELGFSKVDVPTVLSVIEPESSSVATANIYQGQQNYTVDNDHEYGEAKPEKKRKLVTPSNQNPKRSRRRPNQTPHLSNELLKLNRETVNLLSNINNNTDRIANALSIIANVVQRNFPNSV